MPPRLPARCQRYNRYAANPEAPELLSRLGEQKPTSPLRLGLAAVRGRTGCKTVSHLPRKSSHTGMSRIGISVSPSSRFHSQCQQFVGFIVLDCYFLPIQQHGFRLSGRADGSFDERLALQNNLRFGRSY